MGKRVLVIILGLLAGTATNCSDPDVCNFCSGSGVGEDCPRNDPEAKKACLDSVKNHYCGQRPKDCG